MSKEEISNSEKSDRESPKLTIEEIQEKIEQIRQKAESEGDVTEDVTKVASLMTNNDFKRVGIDEKDLVGKLREVQTKGLETATEKCLSEAQKKVFDGDVSEIIEQFEDYLRKFSYCAQIDERESALDRFYTSEEKLKQLLKSGFVNESKKLVRAIEEHIQQNLDVEIIEAQIHFLTENFYKKIVEPNQIFSSQKEFLAYIGGERQLMELKQESYKNKIIEYLDKVKKKKQEGKNFEKESKYIKDWILRAIENGYSPRKFFEDVKTTDEELKELGILL